MLQSDWSLAWSAEELMEIPAELLHQYPPKARSFLADFGMPRQVAIDAITTVTLEPICCLLEALVEDDYDDLASQLVIGEMDIDGGALLLCVMDAERETVGLFDPDCHDPVIFVNSDLGLFARSLLRAHQLQQRVSEGETLSADDIDRLSLDLQTIDPVALCDETCYWSGNVEFQRHTLNYG